MPELGGYEMSDIESITSSTSSESLSTLKTASLGKEDFLEMMIAQLQNQDPLNPLDGTDFTAQLAQFSSLEQLINVNTRLETLELYQASLNNAQSVGLIGKEVVTLGNSIEADGTSADLSYILSGSAESVVVSIYDEDGSCVDTIEAGTQEAGENSVTWDCSGVTAGSYTFEVSAIDTYENAVSVDTTIVGKVTGVSFEDGVPILSVNGQDVSFSDIISVNAPGTES